LNYYSHYVWIYKEDGKDEGRSKEAGCYSGEVEREVDKVAID